MIFNNFTPFSPLHFESRDEKQNDFGVVVLRGTFHLESGRRLRMVQQQEPILFKDQYYGDPQTSSLQFESCMPPFKPNTDVLVNANAYSPSGFPEPYWDVSLKFGPLQKCLTVTGPRTWQRQQGGFLLSAISPVDSVAVCYENAFGGCYTDEGGKRHAWPENPVGKGFVDRRNREPVPAPQVFADRAAAGSLAYGRSCQTAGLGAVAPHWAPRNKHVGTYNEMWKRTRFPDLPADFDFRFYNSGSTGMTLDGFANGDEQVELVNLTPERTTTFQLPNIQLGCLMRFESGEILPGPVLLDTVHIDTFSQRVFLTWRTVYPVTVPMRALEIRAREANDDAVVQEQKVVRPVSPNLEDDDIYYPDFGTT